MAKSRATQGNNAQFTYDFGISIAQSTVNKLTRLTGATLTLASAFYALRTTSTQYVDTLRENTLRFGGVLSTMKAMEQAQDRLIKGQSYFSVDDQLKGMNQLMSAGINVGENLEWVNKAAHATGKSFSEFSGMIASAIQGNSQALVNAGLMTQRATRVFDRYGANTIMRQKAILNFVKKHKGLMNAIKNDFMTVQDQMMRINTVWTSFLQSIIGKPNDPGSFYGQIVSSMRLVADALAKNMEQIRRYGFIIGQVLGWVARQIGHFVVWVGKQVKKTLASIWTVTDDFQNQARSLLVWLEFWKLEILDFFREYSGEIKTLLKLLIAYKALKYVFVIGSLAIKSLRTYRNLLLGTMLLQGRYMRSMGPFMGKIAKFFQSLAVWMPRPFRKAWVAMGKFFAKLYSYVQGVMPVFSGFFAKIGRGFRFLSGVIKNIPLLLLSFGKSLKTFSLGGAFKAIFGFFKNLPLLIKGAAAALKSLVGSLLASNPVGWIIAAITLLVVLYNKSKSFRIFINNLFKGIWEALKLVYNLIVGVIVYLVAGVKRWWKKVTLIFNVIKQKISEMWQKFMNSKVGKWIDDHILTPIKEVFEWVVKAWKWVLTAIGKAVSFLSGANSKLAKSINDLAKAEGLDDLAIAAGGGDYNTKDDTNYLDPSTYLDKETPKTENPLVQDTQTETPSRNTSTTNMTFGNGAVQIIVQKGEGIDEHSLAEKVRRILYDMERGNAMRGGAI